MANRKETDNTVSDAILLICLHKLCQDLFCFDSARLPSHAIPTPIKIHRYPIPQNENDELTKNKKNENEMLNK
ncbi:hypothetical protein ACTXT7_004086 [Hymenolepis weldensis]